MGRLAMGATRSAFAFLMIVAAGCDDTPEPGGTLTTYGKACQTALGKLPLHWSCQKGSGKAGDPTEGAVLHVGLPAGMNPKDAVEATVCDNPPWLPLGKDIQCVEGARLVKISTDNPDTEVRVICRRYDPVSDPVNEKIYQDVAVVATNTKTGDTCFFQALASHAGPLDGTNVPSPMADPSSADLDERRAGKEALKFWFKPEELNSGALKCSRCHDNDAWMHTPYVDQVGDANFVPDIDSVVGRDSDTFSKGMLNHADPYQLVSAATLIMMAGWPQPIAIRTAKVKDGNDVVAAQECTACHRISGKDTRTGDASLGQSWITFTTDGNKVPRRTQRDLTNAAQWTMYAKDYHFMPRNDGSSDETEWQKAHAKHIKALECCAKDPTKYGCASYPIFGVKKGDMVTQGMNKMNKCVDDTGDVSFYMDSPQTASKRLASNRCDAPLDQPLCMNLTITHTLVDGSTQTITTDENGDTLGFCTPISTGYRSDFQVFPADVVDLTLSDTMAWDYSHVPLMFEKWVSYSGDPKDCPCDDPTSTTCHFTTKGAADWFGDNPTSPTFDGDPQYFECHPQFMPAGTCQEVCDANTHQGGDTPETHQVEMGQASGSFTFSYDTYTVKDQIIVSYAGTQLFDTGCVGEANNVPLTYSGTSTKITVTVNPNCEGTTGTAWNFTVGCPQ
jgi:hypothetical protein